MLCRTPTRHLQVCSPLQRSRHQAPTDRAILRLLHCAWCRRARGKWTRRWCSSLPAALGWRLLPTTHSGTRMHVVCHCNGRHQAPTDRASLWLLHGVRCRRTRGACSSLSAALGCRVIAAPTRHLQVLCLCNGAAIKLRLVELACDCSTVCGAGGLEVNELEVRAPICRRHSSAHCLPHPNQAPACVRLCNGAAIKLRLVELACDCSTVHAAGTL